MTLECVMEDRYGSLSRAKVGEGGTLIVGEGGTLSWTWMEVNLNM